MASGAGRGAVYLHLMLLRAGYDSWLLHHDDKTMVEKQIMKYSVINHILRAIYYRLERLFIKYFFHDHKDIIFSIGKNVSFLNEKDLKNFDVIHIHWMTNLKSLQKILNSDSKIFWTPRDTWPMTAGCHIAPAIGCDEYKNACQNCPLPYKKNRKFLKKIQKTKHELMKSKKIIFSPMNQKTKKIISSSKILSNQKAIVIPQAIPVTKYSQDTLIHFSFIQVVKNLRSEGKKLILFSALWLNDANKGFQHAVDLLNYLDDSWILVALGDYSQLPNLVLKNNRIKFLGLVSDPTEVAEIYLLSDIGLVFSKYESFCKVAAEMLFHNLPVICYKNSGVDELIPASLKSILVYDQKTSVEIISESLTKLVCLSNDERGALSEIVESNNKSYLNSIIDMYEHEK